MTRLLRAATLRLALFAVAVPLCAQTDGSTPPLAGVAHIALRVTSLDASRDFYQKLGFEQAFTLSRDGKVYEAFIKLNDHQFIELYPTTDKDPKPGFLHLCFEGDDLNAIHDDYVSRGLTPTPVRKAGAGNLLFTMEGPEHQNIEYTQYQPGSLHTNDQGQHLNSDRVADRLLAVSLAMKDTPSARDFYINQLNFKPIAGDPMFLHMPGDSGQEVKIAQFALAPRAAFVLESSNIAKSGRHLKSKDIPFKKSASNNTLTFNDPDGNILQIEPRW